MEKSMPGFLSFSNKGGHEYGFICFSTWLPKTEVTPGKVHKKFVTLGRVLDKTQLIFRNRKQGIIQVDPDTLEIKSPPSEYVPPQIPRKKRATKKGTIEMSLQANGHIPLSLDFGDCFFLDNLVLQTPIKASLPELLVSSPDSLRALLCYYMFAPYSNNHAAGWLEGNYARLLYPKANLSSQRISELLAELGTEENYRIFFSHYLPACQEHGASTDKVIFDSTGLPNSIHFPLTAISRHNGEYSNEVRLLYVVDQDTGYPVFFRYFPGNVIDATAILHLMAELSVYHLNLRCVLVDAGFNTNKDLKVLYDNHVDVVTRLSRNRTAYKNLLKEYRDSLEDTDNLVVYGSRCLYIKSGSCEIEDEDGNTFSGTGYVCLDPERKASEQQKALHKFARGELSREELKEALKVTGLFVLFSTQPVASKDILKLYYLRQNVEQVFDICKNDVSILPLSIRSEETFRGHLLLTFICTVLFKEMQMRMQDLPFSPREGLINLRNQKVQVFDSEGITTEPTKKINEMYKLLGLTSPIRFHLPRH